MEREKEKENKVIVAIMYKEPGKSFDSPENKKESELPFRDGYFGFRFWFDDDYCEVLMSPDTVL